MQEDEISLRVLQLPITNKFAVAIFYLSISSGLIGLACERTCAKEDINIQLNTCDSRNMEIRNVWKKETCVSAILLYMHNLMRARNA